MLKLTGKKSSAPDEVNKLAIVLPLNTEHRGLDYLIELVKKIRPSNPRKFSEAEIRFESLLYQLQQDKSSLFTLRKALLSQFSKSDLLPAVTESGIIGSRGFVQELVAKIKHKVLPALQRPNDFLYVINHIFYKRSDHIWVEQINPALWRNFFELLGIQINVTDPTIIAQLNISLQVLSFRVTNLGMEKEIMQHFDARETAMQPFVEQNRLVNLYLDRHQGMSASEKRLLMSNIQENLYNCRQSVFRIQHERRDHGTSLAQTFIAVRIQQLIERMLIITDALDEDSIFNTDRFLQYFYTIVRNENRKNSLGEFLSENLRLIAYQIAEHKGKRGQSYITSTRSDFVRLFRGAMGGGLIVSFVAIIKNLLTIYHLPIFWQGMAYSTNYAAGFVLMDRTSTTLATKQPAYTASAVASSLDSRKYEGKPDLDNLAVTIAKVSRSQIASFAGNLLVVFPLTYGLAWLYKLIFGVKIVEGAVAANMLEAQHPYHSLSLLYACFTGFFLFLSGIIAGYVENHVVYGKISERLKSHAVFRNTMSPARLNRLVSGVDKFAGPLSGSIALGFFLGCAGPLGAFLGIPFDIRHITISAGNVAIAYFGLDHHVPFSTMAVVVGGVLLIGFLNFLVSFSLAFFVAIKSRGIRLKDYPGFLRRLGKYFLYHPREFVWPPRHKKKATMLKEDDTTAVAAS
jgi:site-specific recombinase